MIAEALWFFLPAYVANQFPGFGAWLNVPLQKPISRRWLGENKTVAAYYMCPIGGVLTFLFQQWATEWNVAYGWYVSSSVWESVGIGMLFGLGAVAGDSAKSFVKRRLGKKPGQVWWPFDQTDFVFGALLLTYPIAGWRGGETYAIIFAVAIIGHPFWNALGYWLGIRKKWL